jgi:hypothetical protein
MESSKYINDYINNKISVDDLQKMINALSEPITDRASVNLLIEKLSLLEKYNYDCDECKNNNYCETTKNTLCELDTVMHLIIRLSHYNKADIVYYPFIQSVLDRGSINAKEDMVYTLRTLIEDPENLELAKKENFIPKLQNIMELFKDDEYILEDINKIIEVLQ